MFPGFGLEAELMALYHESRLPVLNHLMSNLLDLVEGKPELLSLLLEEGRLEVGLLGESELGFIGDRPELGFDEKFSELRRVRCGFVPQLHKRIFHV